MAELFGFEGRGTIIHHWDADGICTARLLLDRLDALNATPTLGDYSLSKREFRLAARGGWVLIADIALPEVNIRRLASSKRTAVVDHHSQPPLTGVAHHNPVASGATQDEFPSCSWVASLLLGLPLNLWAVLGMVGDCGDRILANLRFGGPVKNYCSEAGLSFPDLQRMADLLDSSFRAGDREGVEEAPRWLLEHGEPADILGNALWTRNLNEVRVELERVLAIEPELIGAVRVVRFSSRANIISAVTREHAWRQRHDTVAVNHGYFMDRDQVYARSSRKDMASMIRLGVEHGYSTGGKTDVLGAVVPKKNTEKFVAEIAAYLE